MRAEGDFELLPPTSGDAIRPWPNKLISPLPRRREPVNRAGSEDAEIDQTKPSHPVGQLPTLASKSRWATNLFPQVGVLWVPRISVLAGSTPRLKRKEATVSAQPTGAQNSPFDGSPFDGSPFDGSPFDDGELYDVLMSGLDYGIDFYVELARKARGPVLEVACGTGRILLPSLQSGADVDGLDLFEPMLACLRKKAAALQLTPGLYQADMSDFRLPRRYALIMITFNAFIHNLTQEAQVRCLDLCRQHLAPGGVLVFDTYFPGLGIVGAAENTRVLEGETRDPRTGRPLRMYDTRTFNRVEQTQLSLFEVEMVGRDGTITTIHRSRFSTRYTYKAEMALLLRVAGFRRWEILGGFDGRPLTRETDGMIVFAWPEAELGVAAETSPQPGAAQLERLD